MRQVRYLDFCQPDFETYSFEHLLLLRSFYLLSCCFGNVFVFEQWSLFLIKSTYTKSTMARSALSSFHISSTANEDRPPVAKFLIFVTKMVQTCVSKASHQSERPFQMYQISAIRTQMVFEMVFEMLQMVFEMLFEALQIPF